MAQQLSSTKTNGVNSMLELSSTSLAKYSEVQEGSLKNDPKKL
jgi:hypothetical protein